MRLKQAAVFGLLEDPRPFVQWGSIQGIGLPGILKCQPHPQVDEKDGASIPKATGAPLRFSWGDSSHQVKPNGFVRGIAGVDRHKFGANIIAHDLADNNFFRK